MPGIPGETLDGVFTLKNLADAIRIKSYLRERRCRRAVILGAGYIAMEMCETLKTIGLETKIVYRGTLPAKKWDPEFSRVILDEITGRGVEFVSGEKPVAIEERENGSLGLVTDSGVIETDMVLMALGVTPEVSLAKSIGLSLGTGTGAVQVDFTQKTSREGVWAAGDCCEVFHRVSRKWTYIPLGDIANKQGRIAGSNLGGRPARFAGVVGTTAFKVFDLEVAACGLSEKEAAESGFNPVSTLVWGRSTARSMGGERLGLKIVADRSSGKLLGAQAAGRGGAVRRIDVLAACLWNGYDLDDLAYLDLAYAPPFGGAWDVIHIAAQQLLKL
jgi:NADPH-dependent 2,4-dienoyl-CoA reductase/sulfur reductase-like enzyme